MFFRRRNTGDVDPWLNEKMWLFTAGALVALSGMLLEEGWVIAVGAVILAAGLALRFLPRGEGDRGEGDRGEGDRGEGDQGNA